MTEEEKITLMTELDQHRNKAFLTCPEDCWCWDVEILLIQEDQDNAVLSD